MVNIYIDPKIAAVRDLHSELLSKDYLDLSIYERLSSQARAILAGHKENNEAVEFHLGSWCPGYIGANSALITAGSLSLVQAQTTIAKEHGYTGWNEVEDLKDAMLDEVFEMAADAVVAGDIKIIQNLLNAHPELVTQKSQYGHRATLLHYIGANGVESYRQITPLNAPEMAQCLILAGADVNAVANIYGGSTTLNLVLTSAHPYNAGVSQAIADVLSTAGAS